MGYVDEDDSESDNGNPSYRRENVAGISPPHQQRTLSERKLALEVRKLKLETEKLQNEIVESKKTYLWRNPQVLPTAIAALGAIIGLGYGFYSNYFTTLNDKAALDQKIATLEKKEADSAHQTSAIELADAQAAHIQAQKELSQAAAKELDAEKTKARADSVSKIAENVIETEGRRIADADSRYLRANAEANRAELTNNEYKAYIESLNEDLFHKTGGGLPEFIYRQQDQLHYLTLQGVPLSSYAWLTDPHLQGLNIAAALSGAEEEKIDLASLHTISPSIKDLDLQMYGQTVVDLNALAGIGSLESLSLFIGHYKHPLAEIHNLSLAKNLKRLNLNIFYGSVQGIGDNQHLPRLSQFGMILHPHALMPSNAVLDQLTDFSIFALNGGMRPALEHDQIVRLAANPHLTSFAVSGSLDISDFVALSHSKSLRKLSIRGPSVKWSSETICPQVTALHISIGSMAEAKSIFDSFPNLRELSITVRADLAQSLIDQVASKYKNLYSLSISTAIEGQSSHRYAFPTLTGLGRLVFDCDSPSITVDLNTDKLPSLRSLVIGKQSLIPSQLRRLPHLESLVLLSTSPAVMEEVQTLSELHTLGLFGDPSLSHSDTIPSSKGTFQGVIDHVPIRDLIIGPGILPEINHLPPSVESFQILRGWQI